MVKCCVPLCTSCSNKTKGISYHEFPVNEDLKKKWVKNIPRRNWNPRETDRVCSLHFQAEDYKSGVKIKQLKPGVIPNVFPSHENGSFLINDSPKQNSTSGSNLLDTSSVIIQSEESPGVAYLKRLCTPVKSSKSLKYGISKSELIVTKKMLKAEKIRSCKLERRVKQLQDELSQMKNTLDNVQKSAFVDNLLQLDSNGGKDMTATFLSEQIRTFGKKRVRWDKKTLEICAEWRKRSPKGYEFPRQKKLLRLPNRFVLERFENSLEKKNSNSTSKVTEEVISLPAEIIILNGNELQMADTSILEDGITTIEIPEKFHDCAQPEYAETYIIHTTNQEVD